MIHVPEPLLRQACRDLHARQLNAGSWPNGLPDSLQQIREIYGFEDDDHWVLVIEGVIKDRAVALVAEGKA